jgi:DNA-binding beta-propeller fold protein YncE
VPKLSFASLVVLCCVSCVSVGSMKGTRSQKVSSQKPLLGLKPVKVVGESRLGSAFLSQPTGITVDPMGNVFIADTGNDRVVKCDREGRFLAEAGGYGWGNGQFNRPTYLDTDNGLSLYVVDAQNKRIQRLDGNLNFVSVIQPQSEGDFLGWGLPEGIAVTNSGEIYVSDTQEDCVVKLDGFLQYEGSFGGFGQGGASLRDPEGICVDENGDVYVADSQNDRVVVFDSFGNALRNMGEGVLQQPGGVAVDGDGQVYVANMGGNGLAVFDAQGQLVTEYQASAPGMANLLRPTDLKLDRGGRLWVADSGNNRILVFELIR